MAAPEPTGSKELQPKVVQKLALRTLLFVLVLGAIFFGIRWYRENRNDPGAGDTADTQGWISAVEFKDNGQEAVAIKPDLSIQRASDWQEGSTDRDVVWDPRGNFIFFISDRKQDATGQRPFHIYRWNPTKSEADQRSVGTRGRSNLSFPLKPDAGSQSMLLTSGGLVMEFDPKEQRQTQLLPPTSNEVTIEGGDEGGGAQSQFAARYNQLGNSFRAARYCGDDEFIAAIMQRDEGDILILQNMTPKAGRFQEPMPVAAGDHIDFDVNQKTGHILVAVSGFQYPVIPKEAIKNGKVVKPFEHYVADIDPKTGKMILVLASPDNKAAFGSLAVNPTGDSFVAVVGPYDNHALTHEALIAAPIKENAVREVRTLVRGEVFEPSWDKDGKRLVYARRDESGKRTIYTANGDGSSERNITGGKANFGWPRFSPQ